MVQRCGPYVLVILIIRLLCYYHQIKHREIRGLIYFLPLIGNIRSPRPGVLAGDGALELLYLPVPTLAPSGRAIMVDTSSC